MIFGKNINIFFAGCLVLILSSCWRQGEKTKVEQKLSGVVVINVLDEPAYQDCHIKGSINIPFEQVESKVPSMVEKTATVITYCSNYMCGASSASRDQLINMGYEKVYAYEGGTAEWFQKGFPVEGPCKKPYLGVKLQEPQRADSKGFISAEELKKKLEENKNI